MSGAACYNHARIEQPMSSLLTGDEQIALAEGIREGDPAAEERFARFFGERIRVMMVVRLRDAEIARELTQDAILAAWLGIREGRLREPQRLAAFVHATARNVVNNYLRAHAGDPRLEPLAEAASAPSAVDCTDGDRHTIVAKALEALSVEDREVLVMTLVRGLKPGEIARALGLSVDVVRTRKSRATKRAIEAIARLSRIPGKPYYSE